MTRTSLTPLFSPLTIAGLTVPNRFVMTPMQRGWARDGAPEARLADYYRRRVDGGVGLVMSEGTAIDHPSATWQAGALHLDAASAPAWRRCVDAVHAGGAGFLIQLWHEGAVRKQGGGRHPDVASLSPSGLVRGGVSSGNAASAGDLRALCDAYVRSALIAQDVGADGVEVHSAHGYLLDLFLWPETNRRADDYGGADITGRARFLAEIVAAIRAATRPDFVISVRFSQWKEVDFEARVFAGPEELDAWIALLRAAGVHMLHASTRRFWTPEWPGSTMGLAGWTKRFAPDLAVATVGSVGLDTDGMTELVGGAVAAGTGAKGAAQLAARFAAGEFDLVAIGRSLIGDPHFVAKLRDGRFDAILPYEKAQLFGDFEWRDDMIAAAHDGMTSVNKERVDV